MLGDICLIELQAFPSIAFMHLISRVDLCVIEACENYNKRTYRNRFELASSKGTIQSSIPLKKGKNNKMPILRVEISHDTPWQKELWATFCTCYRSAPFFIYYEEVIHEMIFQNTPTLMSYNHNNLIQLLEIFEIHTPVAWSTDYQKKFGALDMREQILPSDCIGGITYAQGYESITLNRANLSSLDLLMHMGPEAGLWIKNCSLYSILR